MCLQRARACATHSLTDAADVLPPRMTQIVSVLSAAGHQRLSVNERVARVIVFLLKNEPASILCVAMLKPLWGGGAAKASLNGRIVSH